MGRPNSPTYQHIVTGCEDCFGQGGGVFADSDCGPRYWMKLMANAYKTGAMGGFNGKQVIYKVVIGYRRDQDGPIYIDMVSGPQPANEDTETLNYILSTGGGNSTWEIFRDTKYLNLVENVCEEIDDPSVSGDPTFNYYEARPCCDGVIPSSIIVSVDDTWSPTVNSSNSEMADGFNYNGNCYYFYSATTTSFSGYSETTVFSGDSTYRLCLPSYGCCDDIEKAKFVSCCDNTLSIVVSYNESIAGTPSTGDVIYTPVHQQEVHNFQVSLRLFCLFGSFYCGRGYIC